MIQKKVKEKIVLSSLVLLITVTFFGCGTSKEIISSWQSGDIKIDGSVSDWGKNIQLIPKEFFSVGFKNDDKFLYIGLTTSDRSKIFEIFRSGLIVWFKPDNPDYKTIGIKYPLTDMREGGMKMPEMDRGGIKPGDMNENGRPRENPGAMFEKMLVTQNELEIINEDKYPLMALPLANKDGIEVKLGFSEEKFVYELKIPLAVEKQYSFTAGAIPGEKIKVIFETEKAEMTKRPEDGGGMKMGGGGQEPPDGNEGQMPGGSGPNGAPGGGKRPGGKSRVSSDPLNYTFVLDLAKLETVK
jgi:hypothetical protein